MCTTFFKIFQKKDQLSKIKFAIGFNRDICLTRGTQKLAYFQEDPHIVGGRDNLGGGSWFLFNIKTGNIAFLTNLDDKYCKKESPNAQSRGKVIYNFVRSDYFENNPEESINGTAFEYLKELSKVKDEYNGFNIMVGNLKSENPSIFHLDFSSGKIIEISQNEWVGLSNSPLEQPYEKVVFGVEELEHAKIGSFEQFKEQMENVLNNVDCWEKEGDYECENQIRIEPYWSEYPTEWLRGTKSQTMLVIFENNSYWVWEKFIEPQFNNYNVKKLQKSLTLKYNNLNQSIELTSGLKNLQRIVKKVLSLLMARKKDSKSIKWFKTILEGELYP